MNSYLIGKIIIDLGGNYIREYQTGNEFQSKTELLIWKKNTINELPETYKRYGDIKLYSKRIYPNIKPDIYKSEWKELNEKF